MDITLYSDRLEVLHDGKPFDEKDVWGICGVGEGTKPEDLTKIGKFGIGFKSVYAYTNAPKIHCGDEHFGIEYYVRPYAIDPVDIPAASVLSRRYMNKVARLLRGLIVRWRSI